jgi:HSP20 family protein
MVAGFLEDVIEVRRKTSPTDPRKGQPMLMRTDPFRDLDRLAQQVLGTPARPAAMPIDAFRQGDEFIIHFDLPGVDASAIELTVEKNVLTVHARRDRPTADDVEMLVAERPQGTFSRQLFLGDTLDADALTANYADGVLTLRIPVAEKAKPRRVEITSAGSSSAIEAESRETVGASA